MGGGGEGSWGQRSVDFHLGSGQTNLTEFHSRVPDAVPEIYLLCYISSSMCLLVPQSWHTALRGQ